MYKKNINVPSIANSLGKAKPRGTGWICCCPAHDDNNPSLALSLDERTGKLLAYCFAGCLYEDVIAALINRGLLPENLVSKKNTKSCVYQPKVPKVSKAFVLSKFDGSKAISKVSKVNKIPRKIWLESISAQESPVASYLSARGYNGSIPVTIKYQPQLLHNSSNAHHPAMVAAITKWPDKTVSGIHRTYLNSDGSDKAQISPNKMMLGNVKGGAVRLSPPGQKLILAEGIETVLSCFGATEIPTWACLSTSGMVNVVLPPLDITQEIIIGADGDIAGENAARTLTKRLIGQGYTVRISIPPKGQDFNDVLSGQI